MSQWGCCYYADAGWTYDQILSHYYVNTSLALSSYYTQSSEPTQTDTSSSDGTEIPQNMPQNTPSENPQSEIRTGEPESTEPAPQTDPVTPEPTQEQPAQDNSITEQTLS